MHLEPMLRNKRSPAPQQREAPLLANRESPCTSTETQCSQKKKKKQHVNSLSCKGTTWVLPGWSWVGLWGGLLGEVGGEGNFWSWRSRALAICYQAGVVTSPMAKPLWMEHTLPCTPRAHPSLRRSEGQQNSAFIPVTLMHFTLTKPYPQRGSAVKLPLLPGASPATPPRKGTIPGRGLCQ